MPWSVTTFPNLCSFCAFLFSHALAISCAHFLHLSVSLFCIYRMPVTVKALMWEFIYVLPTLFAFPYCFTDVGSSGKEPAVLDHHIRVFSDKHNRNFLCRTVHFSEVNGINKSLPYRVKILYVLCLYHGVNRLVPNAFVHALLYFTRVFFMTAVSICLTCN